MAHIDKFKRGAVGHLLEHDSRGCDNISNESIDYERSHLNYNLAKHDNPMQYYHQRLNEIFVAKRKDLNTLASWCVTLPKDVPEEEEKEFFQKVYEFSAKRYGEENVVSAFVHKDEKTPHLHFKFIPVVADEKKEQGAKVCFDKLITRGEMRNYQKELQKYLEKELGHKVSILNGATGGGNKTVQQMKAEDIAQSVSKAEKEHLRLVNDINIAKDTLDRLNGEIKSLEDIKESLGKKNWRGKISLSEEEVLSIKYYIDKFGSIENAQAELEKLKAEVEEIYRTNQVNFQTIQKANDMLSEKENRNLEKEKELSKKESELDKKETNIDRLVEERIKDTLNFYDDFIYRNGLWDDFVPELNKFLEQDKKALKRANKTVER